MLPEEEQFGAVLSPPLFLSLALLLAHAVATALGQTDSIIANQHGLAAMVSDNASALVLRVIVFAAFPLVLAARMVRHRRIRLDRGSLRLPFYEQCYPAAVFALGLSVGTSFGVYHHRWISAGGHGLIVLGIGYLRAAGNVVLGLIEGAAFLLVVGFLFTR